MPCEFSLLVFLQAISKISKHWRMYHFWFVKVQLILILMIHTNDYYFLELMITLNAYALALIDALTYSYILISKTQNTRVFLDKTLLFFEYSYWVVIPPKLRYCYDYESKFYVATRIFWVFENCFFFFQIQLNPRPINWFFVVQISPFVKFMDFWYVNVRLVIFQFLCECNFITVFRVLIYW